LTYAVRRAVPAAAKFLFLRLLWLKYPRNEVKNLDFRDRFDILMEIRLSGTAKRLIWEMSG